MRPKLERTAAITTFAALLICCSVSFTSKAYGDPAREFGDKSYKDMESEIRKEWEKLQEFARIERDRKIKAGEPLLSAADERLAIEGMKRPHGRQNLTKKHQPCSRLVCNPGFRKWQSS